MKPIYLYDLGIRPWEQTAAVIDQKYATVTIVQRSVADLFVLWVRVAVVLMTALPNVIKWRSLGYSVEGSRMQEIKLLKQLKGELASGDILRKNESTGVYSYVKRVLEPVFKFDLNTVTQSRYSMLLFAVDDLDDLSGVWGLCRNADGGMNADCLANVLCVLEDVVVCRVVESDTHAVAQFIGKVSVVDKLLEFLAELNVERVSEQEVLSFIN